MYKNYKVLTRYSTHLAFSSFCSSTAWMILLKIVRVLRLCIVNKAVGCAFAIYALNDLTMFTMITAITYFVMYIAVSVLEQRCNKNDDGY